MSHIVEFEIYGLAGRKDVYKQKLNRDVNIFFGFNGTGKTSLLRILDSAMSRDSNLIKFVPFKSAKVKIYSLRFQQNFDLSINMGDLNYKSSLRRIQMVDSFDKEIPSIHIGPLSGALSEEDKMPMWKIKPKTQDFPDISWAHMYLPTWRLNFNYESYSLRQRGEIPEIQREYDWDKFFAQKLEEIWSSFNNRLLREVKEIQEEGLANILRGILKIKPSKKGKLRKLDLRRAYTRASKFLARQGSQDILGSLESFGERYTDDSQIQGVISDINTIEQRIEETMASREKLKKLITDMFTGNKKLIFKDEGIEVETDDKKKIGLTSLSSGEKHSLWIFIETLLVEMNTLLIDEPEMSMHVDWQNHLVSAMGQLNPHAQLIIATHSPEIMVGIDDDKIFRL